MLVGFEGFDEDTIYDRCVELDQLRYKIDLQGFMLRATSQYQREWCRISKQALRAGYSSGPFAVVLMKESKSAPYVCPAELIFFTLSPNAISELREVVKPAAPSGRHHGQDGGRIGLRMH